MAIKDNRLEEGDLVYIAGPMTGIPDANRAKFAEAERIIKDWGGKPLNPATGTPDGLPYAFYMARALAMLNEADTIALLPEWWSSAGARFELECAKRDGKK